LRTINQLFDKSFNPDEAAAFIESIGDKSIKTPQNFEEQALKFIGKELYYTFFYGYTKKQWGVEPKLLPASILKRLPVRFNYNDNYHLSTNTGIPKDGYTAIFEKMLDHPNIKVHLNTNFDNAFSTKGFDHVFYTGPIDAYFEYKYGRLGYRTIFFESFNRTGDFQGTAQMNYTDFDVPHTRIICFKHFTPWLNFEKTTYAKEYSKETTPNDIPYYPKRLSEDMEKLNHYQKEVNNLKNVTFLGRLATYRYMDMHQVIAEALDIAKQFVPK
jgi:UDP-galactopyranose mutase